MSNYYAVACRPKGKVWEGVTMIDDFYGEHEYGVQFLDGQMYRVEDCKFPEVIQKRIERMENSEQAKNTAKNSAPANNIN